jgi:hypothetical protein
VPASNGSRVGTNLAAVQPRRTRSPTAARVVPFHPTLPHCWADGSDGLPVRCRVPETSGLRLQRKPWGRSATLDRRQKRSATSAQWVHQVFLHDFEPKR